MNTTPAQPQAYDAWIIEIIDVRTDHGYKTGKGAGWATEVEARENFERIRGASVERGEFLVDLHNGNNDLIDTVQINADVFETLTGEAPLPSYKDYDQDYWRKAKAARGIA